MTDFTKQITATMTPGEVATAFAKWVGTVRNELGGDDIVVLESELEELIAADRAARERGYTPGERMPPLNVDVLIERPGGRVVVDGYYSTGDYETQKRNIVRWWHLPGGKR